MKKLKQFVYYGPGYVNNNPIDTEKVNPWTTNLFSRRAQVSHLGIQGEPGLRFCLNGSKESDAITISNTGVYEIDLNGIGCITELRFLNLDRYYPRDSINEEKKLIVDFVYEGAI